MVGGGVGGGVASRLGFEHVPQVERVPQEVRVGDLAVPRDHVAIHQVPIAAREHSGAQPRSRFDEALGGEGLRGFAHAAPADVESIGEVCFIRELAAGLVFAGHDPWTEPFNDSAGIVRWGPSEPTIGLSPLRQLHWPIIESLIHKESAEDHRRGDHGLGECACSTTSAGAFRTKPLNFRFTSCSAVRCTPDEFHTAAKRVTAHGYLALKPDPFGAGMFELDPTQTARSLALAEEAVGHRRDAPPADGAAQRGRADFDGRRPAPGRDHGQPQDPGVLNDFADPLAADCEPGLPEVVDGYFPLPTAPGLGISLDRDAIAAHPRQRVNVNLFRSGSELREATAGQAG